MLWVLSHFCGLSFHWLFNNPCLFVSLFLHLMYVNSITNDCQMTNCFVVWYSYGNMALFYHGLNQTELALRHMARTLLLLNVSCGSDHPDVAATFINIAMMYQDIGKMNVALRYLQEALKRNERLLGHEHIQTAVCYHALAIAFNCMGAYKLSLQVSFALCLSESSL